VKLPGKLLLVCAAAALLSVFILPFVSLRANRTATGSGMTLASVSPGQALFLAALVISVPVAYSFSHSAVARTAGTVSLVSLIPSALIVLSLVSSSLGRLEAAQVRISMSAGFWMFLGAVYGMIISFAPALGRRSGILVRTTLLASIAFLVLLFAAGGFGSLSLLKEYANRKPTFLAESLRHFMYAGGTTLAALVIGVPLGYAASRSRVWERPVFFLANMAQAFPTISLLGLMIVPLSLLANRFPVLDALGIRGIGWAPAAIVLFLYALLPISANAHAGFRMIEPSVLDAAKGLGMRGVPLLFRVQLPLALPAIIGGLRTAFTQNLGNAVLAGLICGGGLGSLIFLGLAQAAPDLILLGVLPLVAMVLVSEQSLGALERLARTHSGSEGTRTC
jgi:osmoprotectant transport system permease protein